MVTQRFEHGTDRSANWVLGLLVFMVLLAGLTGITLLVALDLRAVHGLLLAALMTSFLGAHNAQTLDRRRMLPRGPRMFATQLQGPLAILALLISGRAPAADMPLAQALQDWAIFGVIIGLIAGVDLVWRWRDLRHRRAVIRAIERGIARPALGVAAIVVVAAALSGQSAAQMLWTALIAAGALLQGPALTRIKIAPDWRRGQLALRLSRVITLAAAGGVIWLLVFPPL